MKKQKKLRGKSIEEQVIKVCLRIAKKKEGALIIIGDEVKYTKLVQQITPSFNILKNAKLLEALAKIDGAVIIDTNGMMVAYGVLIKPKKVIIGMGTRHSASVSASMQNLSVTSYMVSEEEQKIKIFRNGKQIIQIDATQKGVEEGTKDITDILQSIGIGTLSSAGAGLLLPTLGIGLLLPFLPGVVLFGSAAFIIQKVNDIVKYANKSR